MKKLILFAIVLLLIPTVNAASYDIVIARGDFPVDSIVAQGYKSALIIGGEDAVSKRVENNLERLNYSITRLWDWNRYGTAARVAVSLWETSETVIVAPGDQKGSLISAGRIAIDFKSPLLLVETNKVPDETKAAISDLRASRIILAGNVSENVKSELAELGGLQPTEQTQIALVKQTTDSRGLFVIGILVGGLVIFLISSLFSVGVFRRKMEVPYEVLSEDEKKIAKQIEKHGNSGLKQEELPSLTGFSRPKVTRLTSELEERDIIEKKKVGKTYILLLKRPLK